MYLDTARANTNILGAHRATHPYMHTNKPVFGAVAAISLFLANTCVREKDGKRGRKRRKETIGDAFMHGRKCMCGRREIDKRKCMYAWSKMYVR